jgi:hypothetical protein
MTNPDTDCPDFDQTLRNMLSMPPVRHQRPSETDDEPNDDSRGPEDEAAEDLADG